MAKKQLSRPPQALTVSGNGLMHVLCADIHIAKPNRPGTPPNRPVDVKAIWDTGATGSMITKDVAAALNLFPIGKSKVTGINETKEVNIYRVLIILNGSVRINANVSEAESLTGGYGALIGMDVMTLGDFCVTNRNGKTKFTFQIPSTHDTDYVTEINDASKNAKLQNMSREERRRQLKHMKKKGIIK